MLYYCDYICGLQFFIRLEELYMREETFKMEREGLVKEGDTVEILERSSSVNYHYIIEPAVAMSGCFYEANRIKSKTGIVKKIEENDRGFYVIVEFDE